MPPLRGLYSFPSSGSDCGRRKGVVRVSEVDKQSSERNSHERATRIEANDKGGHNVATLHSSQGSMYICMVDISLCVLTMEIHVY